MERYPWLLRNAAQRFLCAAAMRFRASALNVRFLRGIALPLEAASLPVPFGGLPGRRPIIPRTWFIWSSNLFLCASKPWSAASRISALGAADLFGIYLS